MSISQSSNNSLLTTSSNATTTFIYPGCAQDSTGPCALQTSSADACSSRYPDITEYYQQQFCQCTNGYYSRRSECRIDCYGYGATTTDSTSISLLLAMASVDCLSYSLAAESQSAFYASLSRESVSRASVSNASMTTSSSRSANGTAAAGSGVSGTFISAGTAVASQGATASVNAPQQTTDWVERPSSTVEVQQGNGVKSKRVRRGGVVVSSMIVLVLLSALL